MLFARPILQQATLRKIFISASSWRQRASSIVLPDRGGAKRISCLSRGGGGAATALGAGSPSSPPDGGAAFRWVRGSQAQLAFACLALDAAVPPLTLLGFVTVGLLLGSCMIALISGVMAPLMVSSAALMFFSGGLVLAWARCGSDLLPARTLITTVPYFVGKLPALRTYACFEHHEMGQNRPQQTGLKSSHFI